MTTNENHSIPLIPTISPVAPDRSRTAAKIANCFSKDPVKLSNSNEMTPITKTQLAKIAAGIPRNTPTVAAIVRATAT